MTQHEKCWYSGSAYAVLSASFSQWLWFLSAGIKDLVKTVCPRRTWTDEHGQIERIVLLALWCYWTAISRCNTSPCWRLCTDKQKKPTKSLSLWLLIQVLLTHRFDMLSMCKQRYCFLDSAVSNAIRMLGCCLSALPIVNISLLFFFFPQRALRKGV